MSGIALNEDNSHFFSSRRAEDMTVEGVKELVDHYAVGQVRELLFCPNAMRTSYASRVWQPIWDGYDPVASKVVGFEAPLSALHDGDNVIEISTDRDPPGQIVWTEIRLS